MPETPSNSRRNVLRSIGAGLGSLTLAGTASADFDPPIKLIQTERFTDEVPGWQRDVTTNRIQNRLHDRVTTHIVEADAVISRNALSAARGHDWASNLDGALYQTYGTDFYNETEEYIVLDYVAPSDSAWEDRISVQWTSAQPTYHGLAAGNYWYVDSNRLNEIAREYDTDHLMDRLPDEHDYYAFELAFWIFLRLAPLRQDALSDIDRDFARAISLNDYSRVLPAPAR